MLKPNKPASGKDGMNFAQLIHTETRKAVRSALKKVNCGKMCCNCHKKGISNSDSDYWSVGSDSTGNLHVVKKTKTSKWLVDTHSCPIKAIPSKNSYRPVSPPEDTGVMALVAIMEPVTENLSSKCPQIPLRSWPNNNILVLMDTSSNGDLFFHEKGKPKPFPYLTTVITGV